jgi:23S rRNA pseudouridine2605 synthase
MAKIRLQKILASAGLDSRRKCEQLILDGFVRVNRKLIDTLPAFADPAEDLITVYGKRLPSPERVYFLLNKPKGVICTNSDPQRRKKAIDFIDCEHRIFCVGRLDADTTGAIILTNDSQLANRLTHPRYELPKTYQVTVKGRVMGPQIDKLKKGMWLSEGKTNPAAVKVVKRTNSITVLDVSIRQGLNRQIRRVMAKLDHPVKSLHRIKIGNISVKGLRIGGYKKLTKGHIDYLKKETKGK